MDSLKVTLLQYDIAWEKKHENFATVERMLASLDQFYDLIVLPEMFSTGFSMNSHALAEEVSGETIKWIKSLATKYDAAICGSFIAKDGEEFFNRGFFITPESDYFYDKRHLFRMGSEAKHFSAGANQLIVSFRGFNICLLVCYDLRFPVWARNVDNQYDLLLFVANWPESRAKVWNALLLARAIENLSYVCGVNRIGMDGMNLPYVGDSSMIDFKGNVILHLGNREEMASVILSKEPLDVFRQKFPVWKDADCFRIC